VAHRQMHCTLLSEVADIKIMRVDNGWIIRTAGDGFESIGTPLQVAETPGALLAIVNRWASAQHKP
jgi:hypothetical protein